MVRQTGSEDQPEDRSTRLARLRMRAWRRGTREMDLILGRYADARIAKMDGAQLDAFEALLDQPDPALYDWIAGHAAPPAEFSRPVADIAGDLQAGGVDS